MVAAPPSGGGTLYSITTAAVAINIIRLLLLFPCLAAVDEDVHLIEFKNSFLPSIVPSPLDSTWIKGTDPCDDQKPWQGVECTGTGNNKAVELILLSNLSLTGPASSINIDALLALESLRHLDMENNNLAGTLPAFNRLVVLTTLFLSGNKLFGELPYGYFDGMESLKEIRLARNGFTGAIPASLTKLESLVEVNLSDNDFSGPVPTFNQTLEIFDLANNNLQGEIPETMSKYPAAAFQGNPDLCGPVISKECKNSSKHKAAGTPNQINESHTTGAITKWAILGIVATLLLITILFKAKKKEDNNNFSIMGKEQHLDEHVVQVHVPSLARKVSVNMSRRKSIHYEVSTTSKRGLLSGGKSSNDLYIVNDEKGVFGLADMMKAAAEILGSSPLGSCYKAKMENMLSVVVKRMHDTNTFTKDEFTAEVKKLGKVKHRNVSPVLACHYRIEEKLLVSEFIPGGSLSNLLHGDQQPAQISWPTRLKIIKGVARGMGYLHTEFAGEVLPHGNLKSTNILLSSNYEPLLSDYGLYNIIYSAQSAQSLFACKCLPEEEVSKQSDVYCLGIVILEIMMRKIPLQTLACQKGGTDIIRQVAEAISDGKVAGVIDPEIASASDVSINQMEKMLRIAAACTESDREMRIDMRKAIRRIEEIQI